MVNIESRFGNGQNYRMNRAQLEKINFSGEKLLSEPLKQERRKDIYMEMPIRALGYTNEVGEALRPVIGKWAWASWVPAIAYIGSDVADKYQQDEFGNQNSGCNDYTITELTENEVFATISEIDFEECGIDPDNLRARVRKINDVFEYTFYNLQIQK